jgi:hypothetical protein
VLVFSSARGARLVVPPVGGAAWAGFNAPLGGGSSLTVELVSCCGVLRLLVKRPKM